MPSTLSGPSFLSERQRDLDYSTSRLVGAEKSEENDDAEGMPAPSSHPPSPSTAQYNGRSSARLAGKKRPSGSLPEATQADASQFPLASVRFSKNTDVSFLTTCQKPCDRCSRVGIECLISTNTACISCQRKKQNCSFSPGRGAGPRSKGRTTNHGRPVGGPARTAAGQGQKRQRVTYVGLPPNHARTQGLSSSRDARTEGSSSSHNAPPRAEEQDENTRRLIAIERNTARMVELLAQLLAQSTGSSRS
ncbi:hypothetical protein FA95DRAFT_1557970 [Auriscalpium vulgare]|uniref:Uncharacterized protein n=1 Tax=Auriscalpium vulgare TaxID=40419 RepID=A0ACB8RXB2_9AGAM|nr:hypothetical protein FA95DRAFT_1557970 [Auriscalpium vulgare]